MTSALKKIEEALEKCSIYCKATGDETIIIGVDKALELLRAHGNAVDVEELRRALNILENGKTVTDIYTRDEIVPVDVEIITKAAESYLAFITDGEK